MVSLNMWGFTPAIFDQLQSEFGGFLKARGQDEKAEFFISSVVGSLIAVRKSRVKVLRTPDSWFGITYREDRELVVEGVNQLVARGAYPAKLWGGAALR
jgi:hypothetical protein